MKIFIIIISLLPLGSIVNWLVFQFIEDYSPFTGKLFRRTYVILALVSYLVLVWYIAHSDLNDCPEYEAVQGTVYKRVN